MDRRNLEDLKNRIIAWLENYKTTTKCRGVVIGISGGKDSTVVAMLAKKVWGDNVLGVLMPNGEQKDISDSKKVVESLNLRNITVNISELFSYLIVAIGAQNIRVSEKATTNIPPRLRMTTLYTIAQSLGYRVIGTGNASENYCSWFTKWGDGAYDFNPILGLTKTEVVELGLKLAEEYNLDSQLITKSPADGLTGKSDEDNFGFSYDFLDRYLCNELTEKEILENKTVIDKIEALHTAGTHKRTLPDSFKYD